MVAILSILNRDMDGKIVARSFQMFIVKLVYRERQISVGLVPLILWRGIVADLLLPRGRQRSPLYPIA
jgi:hypothetical protein